MLEELRGGASLGIVCVLLYAEEAGVPLPFAPGEAVLVGAYLLLNRLPGMPHRTGPQTPSPRWRLAAAATLDVGLVAMVMAVVGVLTGLEALEPTSSVSTVAVVGILSLVYLAVTRRVAGFTAGEALLRVRYP